MSTTHSVSASEDGRIVVDGGRWDPYDPASRQAESERIANDPAYLRRQIVSALEYLSEGNAAQAAANLKAALNPHLPTVKDLEWTMRGWERVSAYLEAKGNQSADHTGQGESDKTLLQGNHPDPHPSNQEKA
jgi:hypothetical protein